MCHTWRRKQRRLGLWGVGSACGVHVAARGDTVGYCCDDDAKREYRPEEEPRAEPRATRVGEQGGEGAEGTVGAGGRLGHRTRYPGADRRTRVAAHREEAEHCRAAERKAGGGETEGARPQQADRQPAQRTPDQAEPWRARERRREIA